MAEGARSEAVAKKTWCVPNLTPEFRERMEDVLDQYEKPYDSREPVICMDEQPYQMLDDVRPSQRASPGKPAVCFKRENRSSSAAQAMPPSDSRTALASP